MAKLCSQTRIQVSIERKESIVAFNPTLKQMRGEEMLRRLLQSKLFISLLLIPLVVAAATWGPISVAKFGGNNSHISAAEDEALGWPGAGAAMRQVLYSAYVGGKLKKKDRIKFIYEDGKVITTVYLGGFLLTSPQLELLSNYLQIYLPNFCLGRSTSSQVASVVNLEGYWHSVTGGVTEVGGIPELTTDGWWEYTSLSSFDMSPGGVKKTCSAPI